MTTSNIDTEQLKHIFFPRLAQKTREVLASGGRFVYYTTADTATSILRNRQFWMRNTTTMNDYMEVEHGFECLNFAYKAKPGDSFNSAIDSCFAGLSEEVKNYFNAWLPDIRQGTYITCMSEHSYEEDQNGRLSMWRAYGAQAGIALVINGGILFSQSDALGAYSSPVSYLTQEAFAAGFVEIVKNIEREADYIKTLDREQVKNILFNLLRFTVLCTKHPGFHEEREWRIVASPAMHHSKFLIPTVEIIKGIPQTVLKVDLQNHPEQGLNGLSLPEILDHIIIGPCEFPQIILEAFRKLLVEAGVSDPDSMLVVSDIPLRNNR